MRFGPYRFFFYSGDAAEPIRVHVRRDRMEARFWLRGVDLARNHGFPAHELMRIASIVREKRDLLEEAWHDFYDS